MTALPKPSPPPHRMTVAEFLDWRGGDGGQAYELVDGEPYAMSPASITHGTLQMTLGRMIDVHLIQAGGRCRVVVNPGVTPRLQADTNFRVPDLGVTCHGDEPGLYTLVDPVLLIEVLSPSNEAETWRNVWAYATVPSVSEILLVHSTAVKVQLLRRQADGGWPARPETIEVDGDLTLASIGFSCALGGIYARTRLAHQKQA
jgi:Uma2 family endonuclease